MTTNDIDLSAFDDVSFAEYKTYEVNPLKFAHQIHDAYAALTLTRKKLVNAHEYTEMTQIAFEDCKRDMILGGHVIGKNETERTAKLDDLLRVQAGQLRDAQRTERLSRLGFECAQDEVNRIRALIESLKVAWAD